MLDGETRRVVEDAVLAEVRKRFGEDIEIRLEEDPRVLLQPVLRQGRIYGLREETGDQIDVTYRVVGAGYPETDGYGELFDEADVFVEWRDATVATCAAVSAELAAEEVGEDE